MQQIIKLIRFPNLLIIALTQYLLRYCIIIPFLKQHSFTVIFSSFHFLLLVLSTMLIAAAGYVINDLYDTKTDYINKVEKKTNISSLNKNSIFLLYYLLNSIGLAFGIYISYINLHVEYSIIFLLIIGMLWFYSTEYKKQLILGNLIVALLTGFVPLIVLLYEFPPLINKYAIYLLKNSFSIGYISYYIIGYGLFAFLTTFIREIIKDVEDYEGDSIDNRNTIPIFFGIKIAKSIIVFLILCFICLISFTFFKYIYIGLYPALYILGTIIFPSVLVIFKIIKAENKENYHLSSMLFKFIMVAGILFMLILKYSIEL